MKLYAKIGSERQSQEAKKGGDEFLRIPLHFKNKYLGQVELRAYGANGWVLEVWNIGGDGLTFRAGSMVIGTEAHDCTKGEKQNAVPIYHAHSNLQPCNSRCW